jgi:hypothetical protein
MSAEGAEETVMVLLKENQYDQEESTLAFLRVPVKWLDVGVAGATRRFHKYPNEDEGELPISASRLLRFLRKRSTIASRKVNDWNKEPVHCVYDVTYSMSER